MPFRVKAFVALAATMLLTTFFTRRGGISGNPLLRGHKVYTAAHFATRHRNAAAAAAAGFRVVSRHTNMSASAADAGADADAPSQAARLQMDVMVFVLSRRTDWALRMTIRETWAQGHANVFFALGFCCRVPKPDRKSLGCVRKRVSTDLVQARHDAHCDRVDKQIVAEHEQHGDLILMSDTDVYRHLPHKVKYCYQWGLEHTTAKWFVKTDDDSVVRVSTLEKYLTSTFDAENYVVVGHIAHTWRVNRKGKWAERHYRKGDPGRRIRYPNFPVGAYGHVVSRPVARYVADNADVLFNYQGEDTSLGIWLQQSPISEQVQWKTTKHATNKGDCMNKRLFLIGHNIKPAKMRKCFRKADEIEYWWV